MARKNILRDGELRMWRHGTIPVSWRMDDITALAWTTAHHRDEAVNRDYETAGHHYDSMTIDICQQDQTLPKWCHDIARNMELSSPAVAMHRMRPGHYLPIHSDLYGAYKRIHNLTDQSITRVIVFLEDHKPGHMLDIDGDVIDNWYAGDWVSWEDETPHAAYNMGLEDRYTLQITGQTIYG